MLSKLKCTNKTNKYKSIQPAVLQNNNDTVIHVSNANDLKGKPIIVGSNNPTQALCSLIEKPLIPIVPFLTTYVKDD